MNPPLTSDELGLLVDPTEAEFRSLSQLVYDHFGIHLTDKKKALVRGRLNKVLKTRGLKTFSQYLDTVRSDPTGLALIELVDRISTNHTFFFREADHFHFLRDVALNELRSETEIRIWCAGCATGEEAYTLAMVAQDWAERTGYRGSLRILATDISLTALETAVAGRYNSDRVRLVPQDFKRKYLEGLGEDLWTVSPALRSLILFRRLNFMDQDFPFRQQFHSVFCRNVMIYFDRETKEALVQKICRHLAPGKYFFIGHSESLGRTSSDLEYVQPSLYRKGAP